MKKNKKGFTLIELLVVVAVIGILASVVLLGLGQVRGRGRDARRIADLNQLQNSLELYFNTCSRYPSALTGLTANSADCVNGVLNGTPVIVNQMPRDPSGIPALMYPYCTNATSNRYVLGALLEDPSNPVLAQQAGAGFVCDPVPNGASAGGTAIECAGGGAASGLYCVTI